ncbi:speriolin-like protein [Huso huso]|uniref:Speriolin-like protein n=1 Tax=Huso huso TaxID=61971 RepID=A0ABR0ZJR1_HUSHU
MGSLKMSGICKIQQTQDHLHSPTFKDFLSTSLTMGTHDQAKDPSQYSTVETHPALKNQVQKQCSLHSPVSDKDMTTKQAVNGKKHSKNKVSFLDGNKGKGDGAAEDRKMQCFYNHGMKMFPNEEKDGRVVGEIAFQLDRRILALVFPGTTRLYGYTVSNIPEKIQQRSRNPVPGSVAQQTSRDMTQRYCALMSQLERFRYNWEIHPAFCEFIINTYGILKQRPQEQPQVAYNDPVALRKVAIDTVPAKFLRDSMLILNCLCELSRRDGKPLFTW